jgi:hypothetical protein
VVIRHLSTRITDASPIRAISEGVRAYALDPGRAKALWAKSEEMVGESLPLPAEVDFAA